MKPLSPTTTQHLNALFSVVDREAAEEALLSWSEDSERLRFAALRMSHGDVRALNDAIILGQTDWRDLLVAADFADDIHAHEKWTPQRLTPDLADHWRSGGAVDGVRFQAGSAWKFAVVRSSVEWASSRHSNTLSLKLPTPSDSVADVS